MYYLTNKGEEGEGTMREGGRKGNRKEEEGMNKGKKLG